LKKIRSPVIANHERRPRGARIYVVYVCVSRAAIVNAKVISLEDAPTGYKDFDKGAAVKFVLDPHGMTARAARC
jgi:glutathione-independent formaldehyde dehydrogenase